jgi:hypothetical protein
MKWLVVSSHNVSKGTYVANDKIGSFAILFLCGVFLTSRFPFRFRPFDTAARGELQNGQWEEMSKVGVFLSAQTLGIGQKRLAPVLYLV